MEYSSRKEPNTLAANCVFTLIFLLFLLLLVLLLLLARSNERTLRAFGVRHNLHTHYEYLMSASKEANFGKEGDPGGSSIGLCNAAQKQLSNAAKKS